MVVLGHRLKMTATALVAVGMLGAWLGLVYHEKRSALPEVFSTDPYQKMIDRRMPKKDERSGQDAPQAGTPPIRTAPETAIELRDSLVQSSENLRSIALAVRGYADAHGNPPPAVVRDRSGQPLYSWRVLVLPYLENGEEVYRQFHLDEPWDSPSNKKLVARMPRVFAPVRRTTNEASATFYQMLACETDKETGRQGDKETRRQGDKENLTSQVSLSPCLLVSLSGYVLVEAGEPVIWTKPVDVSYDPAKSLPRLGGLFDDGFHVAFPDGKTLFIPRVMEENLHRDFLMTKANVTVNRSELLRDAVQYEEVIMYRFQIARFWIDQLRESASSGRLKMEDGGWRMEDGGWRMEDGGWRMKDGRCDPRSSIFHPRSSISRRRGAMVLAEMSAEAKEFDELRDEIDLLAPVLVAELADDDREVREQCEQALVQLGSDAVPALTDALNHPDFEVRGAAADMLAHALPLADKLAERSKRLRTAWALATNDPDVRGAVLAVLEALKDRNVHVRAGAAYHLRAFGPDVRFVVPALVQALNNPTGAREAVHALGELGPAAADAIPYLVEYCQRNPYDATAADALVKMGPEAVPAVIDSLRRPGEHQDQMIQVLGRMGPAAKDAIPVLAAIFQKDRTTLRQHAAQALGQMGSEARSALPALIRGLADNDSHIRFQTGLALLRIDPSNAEARPVLARFLPDDDALVGLEAAAMLARTDPGDSAAIEYLMAMVQRPGPHRGKAAQALGDLGSEAKSVVRTLIDSVLDDLNADAALALVRIDPDRALPVLLEAEREGGRAGMEAVLPALEQLGPKARDVAPDLVELLRHPRPYPPSQAGHPPRGQGETDKETGRQGDKENPSSPVSLSPCLPVSLSQGGQGGGIGRDRLHERTAVLLARLDPLQAVPFLVQGLRGEASSSRYPYYEALKELGPEAAPAVPELIELLKNPDGSVRSRAVSLLGNIGKPAVAALLAVLQGEKGDAQALAVEALWRIGPDARDALPLLQDLMKADDPVMRSCAVTAVGRMTSPNPAADPVAAGSSLRLLTEASRDADAGVRRRAARVLGGTGTEALPALSNALEDKDIEVRCEAVRACGKIGSPATGLLVRALHDPHFEVRRIAVICVGDLPAQDTTAHWSEALAREASSLANASGQCDVALHALLDALKDEDKVVRELAITCLHSAVHQRSDPEALARKASSLANASGSEPEFTSVVPALALMLKDRDAEVRWLAAFSLGALGSRARQAAPALAEVLQDDAWVVRREAALALGCIGPDAQSAIPALREALENPHLEITNETARALPRLGPQGVAALALELGHRERRVRAEAADALVQVGTAAVPALFEKMRDRSPEMRTEAGISLGKIAVRAESVVPAVIEALRDQDEHVRGAAARATGEIGPDAKEGVPALVELLKASDPAVRWNAIWALGRIGPDAKSALPALREALRDSEALNRGAAADSLRKVAEQVP